MDKKKIKILYLFVVLLTFLIYISFIIINSNQINYNEIITLPKSGIKMPCWLLIDLGYILVPSFSCLLLNFIIDKIEIIKWYKS
jgi:hypothetical protein